MKTKKIKEQGDFKKSRASLFSSSEGEPRKETALEGKNKKADDSEGNFFPSKVDSQGEKSQGKKLSKEKKKTAAEKRFEIFWKAYTKPAGEKPARSRFLRLSAKDQQLAIDSIPLYDFYLKEIGGGERFKKDAKNYLREETFRDDFKSLLLKAGVKISKDISSASDGQKNGNGGEVSPSVCVEAFHKKYKETHWTKVYQFYYTRGKVGELWEKLQNNHPEEAKQVYCIIAFGNKYKADWKKDLYNPIYRRGELGKLWKMIQKDYPKKAKAILLDLSGS